MINDELSSTDEKLIELIKKSNSQRAFNKLKAKYGQILYSIAGRYFKNRNNIGHALLGDAIQEGESAILNAAINYEQGKGKGQFENYVKKSITGAMLNYIGINKSLFVTKAMQDRVGHLNKILSKPPFSEIKDKDNFDIIEENFKQIGDALTKKYPNENWSKFLKETVHILAIPEISLYEKRTDKEGSECELLEFIEDSEIPPPLEQLENKEKQKEYAEARNLFKQIYIKRMLEIIQQVAYSNSNEQVLKTYYIDGVDKSAIVSILNPMNSKKGDDCFRKIKSRFEKKVHANNIELVQPMLDDLNKYFDISISREDFIKFIECIRGNYLQDDFIEF